MSLLISIPTLPKVQVISSPVGAPVLLDDFVLVVAILIGIIDFTSRASVTGYGKIGIPPVAFFLVVFTFFKVLDLGFLSLFLPWVGPSGLGRGVMVHEGVLVLARALAFVFVFVLALNSLHHLESIHFVVKLFFISIALVVSVALAQFFLLGDRTLTSTFRNIHALGQISSGWGLEDPWFTNVAVGHEQLGAFMVFSASILGGVLLNKWPRKKRQWQFLTLLFGGCIFTLLFAGSRGAWIGGFFSFATFVWLAIRRGKVSQLLFVVVGGVCLGALLEFLLDLNVVGYIQTRVVKLVSIGASEIQDDSAQKRLATFKFLWRVFRANLIVGLGPGGAGRIAEGQYIRELVEGGLIGGVLFVALLLKIGKSTLKTLRLSRDPLVQGMSSGFLCGLVGLGGQLFFTELFVLSKISVPFWLLAAVVYRLDYIERQKNRSRYSP